jgi:hypothetical protein
VPGIRWWRLATGTTNIILGSASISGVPDF